MFPMSRLITIFIKLKFIPVAQVRIKFFFLSVLTLIFFFSFRKIHLGRRAFSYFTVSVFSCSAYQYHTIPLPSLFFFLLNDYVRLSKVNKCLCLCALALYLLGPSIKDKTVAARLRWRQNFFLQKQDLLLWTSRPNSAKDSFFCCKCTLAFPSSLKLESQDLGSML